MSSQPISHQEIRKANEEYHRFVAADYEQAHAAVFDPHSPVRQRLLRHLDRINGMTRVERYLDLGCGTGALLEQARLRFPQVAGADASTSMLGLARRRGLSVVKGDLVQLPFGDNSFDAVTCISVLHHLHTPEDALTEMVRVCRPGGVIVTDHDPSNEFLLKWPKVNRLFRKFFRHEEWVGETFAAKGAMDQQTWHKVEQAAEYHAGPGMNPRMLAAHLRKLGCTDVRVEYHFLGDLPGFALKIASSLGLEYGPPILTPYFSLWARKGEAGA